MCLNIGYTPQNDILELGENKNRNYWDSGSPIFIPTHIQTHFFKSTPSCADMTQSTFSTTPVWRPKPSPVGKAASTHWVEKSTENHGGHHPIRTLIPWDSRSY